MDSSRRNVQERLRTRANLPSNRRDNSRSPPRHQYDQEERQARHYRERDRDYDRRGRDDGHYRDRPRYDDGYEGMYDDEYDHHGYSDRRSRTRYRENDARRDYSPRRDDGYPARDRLYDVPREAGRPTDTVKLEGLPFGISSHTLRECLLQDSAAAEDPPADVRVVSSKGFCRAFVRFHELGHAASFIREHYPRLSILLPHPTDDAPDGRIDLHVHYARSQADRDSQANPNAPIGNWYCHQCGVSNFSTRKQCRECSYTPQATTGPLGRTGEADVAREVDDKVQMLVIYPLPSDMDEDTLATEFKRLELVKIERPKGEAPKLKSTAPSADGAGYGARPGSLHRVFRMREVATGIKLPYGFAEFWTFSDAVAAVRKVRMTRSFEIAGKPVTVALIHLGVFVPEDREMTAEIDFMSFHPVFNPDMRIRYRDMDVFPSPKLVSPHPPTEDDVPKAPKAAETAKPKKRKVEPGPADPLPKKAPAMAGQMAFWQRRHDEIHDVGSGPIATNEIATRPAPIKFSLTSNSSKTGEATIKNEPVVDSDIKSEPNPVPAPVEAPTQEVSYVDRDRLMCLICMMKYKSVEEVNIHEKSGNHKRAMENEEKVKAALPRLAARDERLQAKDGTQYRDRAKERREAHNQPKKPVNAKPVSKAKPVEKAAKATESKGAGMLAKMGWSGAGLGAQGEGITDLITAHAYRGGVGLGAEGGKLGDAQEVAEGRTKDDYASYVSAAKGKARERYERMA
ncbi:hypothetical protein RJ55_01764 [Drechmeria coniospora]|nr:hypothetical protein RJ55_01764 [Drechmeria coniospora]